jgi:DNA-directed RNA polymerase subunit RPC12/RpoP
MTVQETHEISCPQCGDDTQIDVAATIWVRLTSDGTDVDASNDGSHEWDDTSTVECQNCNHSGTVKEFQTT